MGMICEMLLQTCTACCKMLIDDVKGGIPRANKPLSRLVDLTSPLHRDQLLSENAVLHIEINSKAKGTRAGVICWNIARTHCDKV